MKFNWKYLVVILLLLTGGELCIAYCLTSPEDINIYGRIRVDEIDVASKIPGRIDSLYVQLGQHVNKGDTLAVLESKELDAKLEQAKSVMLASKSKWEMAKNGARSEEKLAVEKLADQAKYQLEFAESTYKRMKKLYADSVISRQKFDEIEFKYNAAKAQYEAAQAKLKMVRNGARDEEKSAAEALYNQALNAYKEALAYYSELTLTAKTTGEVYSLIANQGEIISAGYPVISIINTNNSYAIINIKESEISQFQEGKEIKGYLPALDKEIKFKVTYISPKGDFADWKPTAQKGDFDLKTFEIRLTPLENIDMIRPGMNVRFSLQG